MRRHIRTVGLHYPRMFILETYGQWDAMIGTMASMDLWHGRLWRHPRRSRLGTNGGRILALLLALAISAALVARGGGVSTRHGGHLLPATPTQLPSFDPAKFRQLLAQLKGKPVVVNFWGGWCGPCGQEAPRLAAAARRFGGRVQFLGVDVFDDRTPARAFIRQFGWIYPSVFDYPASIEGSLGMSGQPVTVFFDAAGRQVFIRSGAVQDGEIERELDKILAS